MNRTERLYAITEELRRAGHQGRTGAQIAGLLEISERTVKRDITALQEAGLPIVARPGPGGGYHVDPQGTLPPINFSPSQGVAVSVALAALPPGSPFAIDAATARAKVWDAMAPEDRARAGALASRVWVRHPSDDDGGFVALPSVLRAVERSLASSQVLSIRYVDSGDQQTDRRVEPVILAYTDGTWYLVAWCQLREAIRWFRIERIARADLTVLKYEPRPVSEVGDPPPSASPVA